MSLSQRRQTIDEKKYFNMRRLITSKDALCLFELLSKLNVKNNSDSFFETMKDLKKIVPYKKSVSVIAKLNSDRMLISYGVVNISFSDCIFEIYQEKKYDIQSPDKKKIRAYDLSNWKDVNISYPASWFEVYREKKNEILSPVINKQIGTCDLFRWKESKKGGCREFGSWRGDLDLKQRCQHRLPNLANTAGALFSFSGSSLHSPRNDAILRIVTPLLNIQLQNFLYDHKQRKSHLSKREVEVLKWVKEGKTNWDIATILTISERTVKYHISSILKKLNVVNRSQAVAVALSERILSL